MSTLITSPITFGGATFPITAYVKTRETSSDLDEAKMLGQDGTITPSGVAQAHKIIVSIPVGGDASWDPFLSTSMSIVYLNDMDDLNNLANEIFGLLEVGYQTLDLGYTPDRTIQAQKQEFKVNYTEATGRRNATIDITFYAQDPRYLSATTHTVTSTESVTANAGNMNSYPVVTYTQTGGAAVTPVVLQVWPGVITTPGNPYVELTLSYTMQNSDVLIINCDPRMRSEAITLNGYTSDPTSGISYLSLLGTTGIVNTIGNDATFPYLLPGNNFAEFSGANSISFAWQDAYAL